MWPCPPPMRRRSCSTSPCSEPPRSAGTWTARPASLRRAARMGGGPARDRAMAPRTVFPYDRRVTPSGQSHLTVDDDATVVQGPVQTGPSADQDDEEQAPPRTLGRYTIIDELGVG